MSGRMTWILGNHPRLSQSSISRFWIQKSKSLVLSDSEELGVPLWLRFSPSGELSSCALLSMQYLLVTTAHFLRIYLVKKKTKFREFGGLECWSQSFTGARFRIKEELAAPL